MKNLVWAAAALVVLSLVFPQGVPVQFAGSKPAASYQVPEADPDAKVKSLLSNATAADKADVVGIYTALHRVLSRDGGQRVSNTEKWASLQENTLQLVIEQVNKYPGLDVAIEDVFKRSVGTDDVTPVRGETLPKLLKACETIVASAR